MRIVDIINKDRYRVYGDIAPTIRQRILCPVQLRWLYFFRKASSNKNVFLKLWYKCMVRRLGMKTQIQIPAGTEIGEGFYIGHFGRIIVNRDAVLGKNINISTGVTIGQESRGKREGVPLIGDDVWIGTNAVIVGNISIGNDVLIAPLSYVNFDVPSHSIVIGNPGKIISRKFATKGYITNRV